MTDETPKPPEQPTPPVGHDPRLQTLLTQSLFEKEDATPMKHGLLGALIFHILIFVIIFPKIEHRARAIENRKVFKVLKYRPPVKQQPKKKIEEVKKVKKIPIPDPTPDEPEPIIEPDPDPEPEFIPPDAEIIFGVPEGPPAPKAFQMGVTGLTMPKLTKKIQPEFPALARAAGVTGKVVLECVVHTDGAVEIQRVVKSVQGKLGFEDSAIKAVQQWVYEPGVFEGRAVPVRMMITVHFTMDRN